VGAGPYGLSVAAHLRRHGREFRIFGTPMQSWRANMPVGMYLKVRGLSLQPVGPDRFLPAQGALP
jgi:2-polyprenyl-6-methoxyphenol hydroxylase-like FAD-dependent oxidoreductase